jgi:outer membrane lipoprotein SlyB
MLVLAGEVVLLRVECASRPAGLHWARALLCMIQGAVLSGLVCVGVGEGRGNRITEV